jgi:hypothetical protein
MLGSSFGSTNSASINPDTGKPYGPDFPAIAVRDIVARKKRCLQAWGISISSLSPALPTAFTRHSSGRQLPGLHGRDRPRRHRPPDL